MARRYNNIWVVGSVLVAVALLLCPVYTSKHPFIDQGDEDFIIFDDDEAPTSARLKRDSPDSSLLEKRQSPSYGSDDEDDLGSGSGVAFKTYRVTFRRKEPYNNKFADTKSTEFTAAKRKLESDLSLLFRKIEGVVDIHVLTIGSGSNADEQEVLLDLTHQDDSVNNQGTTLQRTFETAISGGYLDAIPGSQKFKEISDRSAGRCESSEVLCHEGNCAPRCDGVEQCDSGADEFNCVNVVAGSIVGPSVRVVPETTITRVNDSLVPATCPFDKSLCDGNRCVESTKWCDGVTDCKDGLDEQNCPGRTTTASSIKPLTTTPPRANCGPEEVECDSKCIKDHQLCDGVPDCLDQSDELYCPAVAVCGSDEFKCSDNSCIPSFRRCDYAADCPDNEDEENCSDYCDGSGQFNCDDDATCLEMDQVCDSIHDCVDGTDEAGCFVPIVSPPPPPTTSTTPPTTTSTTPPTTTSTTTTPEPTTSYYGGHFCPHGQFRCNDGECLSVDYKCDGKADCRDASDEHDCPCKSDEWRCLSGECIPEALHCEGTPQCVDRSDEENCPLECDSDQWRCGNGKCISESLLCDSKVDCYDGTDEVNCTACRNNEWRCRDGSCIPASQRCDNTYHCADYSDEEECGGCRPGELQCSDGRCLEGSSRCNKIAECPDGSDERDCPGVCKEDEFGCHDDGTCIPTYLVCDGRPYCRDGSDELSCTQPECKPMEFRCQDNGFCIPERLRCDGHKYCYDGSDEWDCRPTPPPTSSCLPPENFLCGNGICIKAEKRCDGITNCQDRSDEANCPSTNCRGDQFICDTGECLNIDRVCNRQHDCPNGEDERACSCDPDQFKCSNGCIPASKRCDGVRDCREDGADELNCPSPPPAPLCETSEFQCTNGQCVYKGLTCDGFPDCNDGSDEIMSTCSGGANATSCSDNEFTCQNSGDCIELSRKCDGSFDCFDQSDERGCPAARDCTADEFRCGDGDCIQQQWRCDKVTDCEDGSDEINCSGCTPNEFECGDGTCIHESIRCDGEHDCADRSDEFDCRICEDTDFNCSDGMCIDQKQHCDGLSHCLDGSDEVGCDEEACPPSGFHCRSGECIPRSRHCDRTYDCIDRSDEENCNESTPSPTSVGPPSSRCTGTEFQCDDGVCIGLDKHCDGFFDCQDLSDEVNCPEPECQFDQFKCDSGDCIDWSLQCNGKYECLDASDELDCDPDFPDPSHPQCSSFEFPCGTGECVSQAVVCDGRRDCLDSTDENDCNDLGGNATRSCDKDREFACRDGSCVSLFAECDGHYDCADYSDEEDCSAYPRDCSSNEFRCGDGQCVSSIVRCDGRDDCLDTSDERDCETPTLPPAFTTPRPCVSDEFRCEASGACIRRYFVCDRKYDCRDGSDERNCPVPTPRTTPAPRPRCAYYEFTCRNGACVDARKQCDSTFDCLDRSDEENCPEDLFVCYNGERIPKRLKCDGRSDCSDGSDEAECRPQPPFPPQPSDSLNLKTYPDDQNIKQNREVVFQCRDEGPNRTPVRWIRAGGQRLPPGSTDIRGRLTMPNIQVEHSGTYYCEAQGVPQTSNNRKSVILNVIPFEIVTPPAPPTACSLVTQATCRNGQCIEKSEVCDGDIDCADGSDEARCDPFDCEPNQFQCDNKQCVSKAWLCDADDDCGDGSDERNCDGPSTPGSRCMNYELACQTGDQCIPKSFHCDNEIDCQDGSDEFGCGKPVIIEPPIRVLTVEIGETFTIRCKAVGLPVPIVAWRLNWGHVPASCTMTSENGVGVLTCVSAQPSHQGAYSCEAINSLGSVFAQPDAIVTVKTTQSVCSPPQYNAAAIAPKDCLNCFCFGIIDQCYSTDRSVSQLPPPTSDSFQIIGVNQDQFQGNYVIRDRDYPLHNRYLRPFPGTAAVQLEVRDRGRLSGPSDLIIYFSLPESHKGSQLTAYGGHLRYSVQFVSSGAGRNFNGPDVIIRGNNVTLMHVHDYTFEPNRLNQIDVRFWPGNWYKRVINRGGRVQSQEPATRFEILTVLADIDLLLIRASYVDGNNIDTTMNEVQLDTALFRQTNQGRAVYVEECRCPQGYTGISCEQCAQNYHRTYDGQYLGRCVLAVACGSNEYGDPANSIPCLPCPCPLTNPANQFSHSCYLDSDSQVTCNCERGYQGRRCNECADGYEGNPIVPGESCQAAGECDAKGSLSQKPDTYTQLCPCKDYVIGPKCSQCQAGSFYLHEENQYGCIKCFCMGITDTCTSSNWYRSQESISFVTNTHGVQLVDQYQSNVINSNIFTDTGRQELVFRSFSELPTEVYYWKLPQRFLGSKVTAYGGNLTYTLSYTPVPGGQSSRNNAYDVEIFGNDVTLRYYSKNQLSASSLESASVPFYEQYWQRQDGQTANREHFLMALADLKYILIKATYTTETQEVGLKEVSMETAETRNTGRERAYAVEMCDCPTGYRGLSCEDCDVGYTRGRSGLHLGTCVPCECNGYSDECDQETRACFNCKDNRGGDYCEVCAEGYYEGFGGKCVGAEPCSCDPGGSVSLQCYDDRCQCKSNVIGDECKSCRDGHFFMSEKNELGCLSCWCNGVTDRCSSSQFFREQIPMNLFRRHGFTLADRQRTSVMTEALVTNIPENKISFTKFETLRPQISYYWSLPQMFTGNRLTSYGGYLSLTQSFESRSASDIYADADIIITSANKREFIWMNKNTLKPGRPQNYSIELVESEFTVDQRPATRAEFLEALSSVEAILIRAQFSESMVSTSLQYVTMDTAVDYQTRQTRAYEVEQCSCPSEYIGFSCEQCAQGYYRDYQINRRCLRCPCNGKEESCVAERNGNVVCNCMPGFSGRNCGMSVDDVPPVIGVLEISISETKYSADVGATIELRCTTTTRARVSFAWDKDGGTLPYGRAHDNRQGTLQISQLRPEDAGTYICRASTGVYVAEERTELVITGAGPSPATKPVVVIEPRKEKVEVRIGQYFEVRCRVSGSPAPQLQWLRDDGRGLSNAVSQRGDTLMFHNPQTSDSGVYICRGRNDRGTTSATITIYVGERSGTGPDIIVQVSEEEVEARPGELVRVTCVVPDTVFRATITITWTREQGELPQKSTQSNGELSIPNAEASDSGIYTCRATDTRGGFGAATTRITVAVYGNMPEVRIEPDRQTVNQGTTAELRCIASGDPKPAVTWSKLSGAGQPNKLPTTGSILRIENSVISDRGMYMCEATNNIGKASSAAILEVERREPPVIEMYPESRLAIEKGTSVMFQCHLTGGIPTPTVTWARANGRSMTPNTQTLSGGVLRFDKVSGEEEGSYICTAVNDAGKMTATATLEVHALPVVTMRPSTSPHRVQSGEPLRIECSSAGDPLPLITWQKLQANYEQDLTGHSVAQGRSVYEVRMASTKDQGVYQCTASNAIGSSVERLQVLVIDNLPGYPPETTVRPNPRPRPRPPPSGPGQEAYIVPLGGDFQFRCFAEGAREDPKDFRFTFERTDGRPLPRNHYEHDGILSVSNVGKDSEGEYVCIITETTTERILVTIHATLQVVEQPSVRLEPPRQVVRPGATVSLRCIVTGAQPITITWSKATGSMPPSVIIRGGELLFRGIATTDTGRYICEATNSVGSAKSVGEVTVNERPLLTALQENVHVSQGQSVDLRCEPSGINPAIVQWSVEGSQRLPPNANKLPSDSVLRITNAQPYNEGRYKCEATTNFGGYTFDFINLSVRRAHSVEVRIRSSSNDIRLGDDVELYCEVIGERRATISWSLEGKPLPYNARTEGHSLKLTSVQPNNGGLYKCTVTASSGVFDQSYPLTIQNIPSNGDNELGSRSVETRSTVFGSSIVLHCNMRLDPPVSFTWSKPSGQLPVRARISDDTIEIPEAKADDAGTYVCTGRNDVKSMDVPTLLIVTGVVPRFSSDSYVALPTLPDAYLAFDLEISFKPEAYDGLILYNSQRDGPGDFISFGMKDGYAEFRFDVGSGPAVLRSKEHLTLNKWHTVKMSRNRKEGTMIIDNGIPVTGVSVGKFQGLDLINPLYIGGVPDISVINDQAGFSTGFKGCVSRLVIGLVISELMRDARSQRGIEPCDTCSSNPCDNGGVCQEAYSSNGHKCICSAGFTGDSCESTGQSCYPGVCGTGRCENIPGGLECFCPYGKTGSKCEVSIEIKEPSFSKDAYMSFSTPRALKRFSVGMLVKPKTMHDGLIMYCGQNERGDGDFISLALKNNKLEFKFNTGTGTATLTSQELPLGEWIKVNANRTDKVGSLQVNNGAMQNKQSPGTSRSLNLRTDLFIGGVDRSSIEVAPDVKVTDGFTGCVSELQLMDLPINVEDSLIESSNVDQCGTSLCAKSPCLNGGQCTDDLHAQDGYVCNCIAPFSGPRCGSNRNGVCVHSMPCRNAGVCQEFTLAENQCLCPLGFAGDLCEREYNLTDTASFSGNSYIEMDRYNLPQNEIVDQRITMEFSTTHPNGLLFWLGQEANVQGKGKDSLSIGVVDGFIDFTFYMGEDVVSVKSEERVTNGAIHRITANRYKNIATLMVDNGPEVRSEGSPSVFSLYVTGNIYIGGTPDLHKMTGSLYGEGFIGCIHSLEIGSHRIDNFFDYALSGVNVTPCGSSNLHDNVIKHTSITTKRKTVTSKKVYHG